MENELKVYEISREDALKLPSSVPILAYSTWAKDLRLCYNVLGSVLKDSISSRHIKYYRFNKDLVSLIKNI